MENRLDFLSQKGLISLEHFSRLSLGIGTYVKITNTKNTSIICRLYPNKSLPDHFCLLERVVQSSVNNTQNLGSITPPILQPIYSHKLDIKPLRSFTQPSQIKITIVVKTFKDIPRLKSYRHGLHSLIKDLLLPYGFTNLSSISLPEGHPTGITSLVILSSDSPHDHILQLSSDTTFQISQIVTSSTFQQSHENHKIVLGGLQSHYAELKRLVSLPLFRSELVGKLGLDCAKSVLLHGPPGCGKTSLVKKLSADCNATLVTIPGASLSSPNPGETEKLLRDKIQQVIEISLDGPCILFLDEIDALCPRRGSGHSHETRKVTQLLTQLDLLKSKPNIVIIGATNRLEELDPAVRRPGRLNREVYIGVPSAAERADIITQICNSANFSINCDIQWLSELTPGYVGADLALLCQEVASMTQESSLEDTPVLFKRALAKIRPSSMRKGLGVVDFHPVQWSEIGGLENARHYVQRAIEWPLKHPEAFHRLGIEKPKGVLLYGPPGCGKSLLVKAAATSCSVTFLAVSAAELFSPYVGDSEKAVSSLFQRARLAAPCILFLDELDAMVGDRGQTQGQRAQSSVISTFLQEMDGIALQSVLSSKLGSKGTNNKAPDIQEIMDSVRSEGVLVVGATNRPDKIDAALLRPGRLDSLVYIPPPDLATRESILRVHSRKMPLDGVNLAEIATKTTWFSGADLEVLCKEAGLKALEEDMEASVISQSHFVSALESVKPSLSAESVSWYETYQNNKNTGV